MTLSCHGRDVQEPRRAVRHLLERLGLSLNEAHTPLWRRPKRISIFWGLPIRMSSGTRTGKPSLPVCASENALVKIQGENEGTNGRRIDPPLR